MTGRFLIANKANGEFDFLYIGGKLYRSNSLSDALDKVEELKKWDKKAEFVVCVFTELNSL